MPTVNPAPIRVPKKLLDDPEVSKYFQDLNFFLLQLFQRTGGGTDVIEENTENTEENTEEIEVINDTLLFLDRYVPVNQAQINDIRAQIGSGDFLTSDETGFTVDSTTLSVDMTES